MEISCPVLQSKTGLFVSVGPLVRYGRSDSLQKMPRVPIPRPSSPFPGPRGLTPRPFDPFPGPRVWIQGLQSRLQGLHHLFEGLDLRLKCLALVGCSPNTKKESSDGDARITTAICHWPCTTQSGDRQKRLPFANPSVPAFCNGWDIGGTTAGFADRSWCKCMWRSRLPTRMLVNIVQNTRGRNIRARHRASQRPSPADCPLLSLPQTQTAGNSPLCTRAHGSPGRRIPGSDRVALMSRDRHPTRKTGTTRRYTVDGPAVTVADDGK